MNILRGLKLMGAVLLTLVIMKPVFAVPAFLPMADQVPTTEAMAIDGVWSISTINKKVRFEAGRAYAVDPWLHLFVLEIQPGMVVFQNISQATQGTFVGDDLPLLSKFNAVLQSNGRMKVSVGAIASYELIPVELDYPEMMDGLLAPAGVEAEHYPEDYSQETPIESCQQLVVDPETNQQVCLD